MFNSLKHKLSNKGKNQSSASPTNKASMNPHPQSNNQPATRRPNNPPGINNPFRDMTDAPPPYSAGKSEPAAAYVPPPVAASSSSNTVLPSDDDPYAFLSSFDTVFLIDDSGSMAGGLWRETKEALQRITPICTAHDQDGIDIFFLNAPDHESYQNVKDPEAVDRIFSRVRPGGMTPTGQKLNKILKPYLRLCEANKDNLDVVKPMNIICITDGAPSDDVESPLALAAKKLDKLDAPAWQIGVQFFQVGTDPAAKAHLKSLDDDLAEIAGVDDLRDMVDTVPYTGAEGTKLSADGILKVVLGAVLRKLDRKKSKDLHR